jgi:paraquat-inducible protein B
MYPGSGGKPRRNFIGLDSPPIVAPGTHGSSFTLLASDLGSLTRGSPVTYRGVDVGVVTAFTLAADGHDVSVTAFIRSPEDRLVHPGTLFWNAGGVAMTLGTQGLQLRANSWQQLLQGGVAFDTSPKALAGAPSPAGSVFELYDNEQSAHGHGTPGGRPLLADTLRNLHDLLRNLDRATAGPQLHDALTSLDQLLTHLDRLTSETRPNINELLVSLRATSTQAQLTMSALQKTMAAVQRTTGGTAPSNIDLQQLMEQLSEAARSVRELADYLDQHPDALLRGRRADSPR